MGILSCFSYSILIVYCSNRNVFKFHKMLFFPQTPFLKHLPHLWHSTCTPFWSQAWVFAQSLSHVWLFATPWTLAHQAPLCMGFPRQEYWNGLPFSFSRGSSRPRDQTRISCIVGRFFTSWATWEAHLKSVDHNNTYFLGFLWEINAIIKGKNHAWNKSRP